VGSQRGAMVGKEHLLDYEVPLPFVGLGHDWACTFREAPLPQCGQSMSFRVRFVRRLHPNSALAMSGQALP